MRPVVKVPRIWNDRRNRLRDIGSLQTWWDRLAYHIV